MHAHQFWWAWPLRFWRYCYFQKRPNFPFGLWMSKNLMIWNRLKKFMQVGIDVTCMHTNFVWRDISGFEDIATFKNGQISFRTVDYSPRVSKNLMIRNRLKNFCKYGLMSHACTPILVGVTSPVSKILLLSKTAKFPFWTMDYNNKNL